MAGGDDVVPDFRVRARFYAIRQADGEPVYDWYWRVLTAAVPCGFGADLRPSAVADKFVTGLRPGPVADRLLGERANSRPEDLVAVAMEVEKRTAAAAAVATFDVGGGKDVIAEIREGLKLYRYSDENVRIPCGSDVRNDSSNRNSKLAPLGTNGRDKTMIGDQVKSTKIDGKSWWKNRLLKKNAEHQENADYSPLTCTSCCDLAANLLESFVENNAPVSRQQVRTDGNREKLSDHRTSYHDDSDCYCSWPTSKQDDNYSVTGKPENSIGPLSSKRSAGTKMKTKCSVCSDFSD